MDVEEEPSTPVVWYESPFGPPEWMHRSQAEALMRRELSMSPESPPRIVEREQRVAELRAQISEEYPDVVDRPKVVGRRWYEIRAERLRSEGVTQ